MSLLKLLPLLLLCSQVQTQSTFLFSMVDLFNSKSVVMHTSITGLKSGLLNAVKVFNRDGEYAKILNNAKNCSLLLENVDIHFVSYDQTAIGHTLDCMKNREKFNKEVWVLLTQYQNIDNVIEDLKDIKLDLDDQVFVTLFQNNGMKIMEIYRIAPDMPISYNDVGSWNPDEGLDFTSVPKWYRRGNLKV